LADVPVEAWRRGVELHPLRLPSSIKDLDILSCGSAQRTIGRQGIEIFSLFYHSPALASLRIQSKGKLKVAVRFDPTDIGTIWVADPHSGRHLAVACRSQSYATGLTLWQHNKVLERLGERRRTATERDLHNARAELRQMIEQTQARTRARKRTRKRQARFTETPSTPDHLARRSENGTTTDLQEGVAASTFDQWPPQPPPAVDPKTPDAAGDLEEFIRTHGFEARER
jgi:putative transposase